MGSTTDEYPFLFHHLKTNDTDKPQTNADSIDSTDLIDFVIFYLEVIVLVCMNGSLCIFGMMANIINIIVFLRQGVLTEYGTAGIFGLAVSDLCFVTTNLWVSISQAIVLLNPPNLSWSPSDVQYVTATWPHLLFSQISRLVTVYIAFERCICVVFPFKVKAMFTPRRTLMAIGAIFILSGVNIAPLFYVFQLDFVTDPITNVSRLIMVPDSHILNIVVRITLYLNAFTINIMCVAVVFICTLITAIRINLSKSWRDRFSKASNSSKKEAAMPAVTETIGKSQPSSEVKSKMQKEEKLVRMIICISLIFLFCYLPYLPYLIMYAIDRKYSIVGKYNTFARIIYSIKYLLDTINSSVNIIVYYMLSSRYKVELRQLFGFEGKNSRPHLQ